MKTYMQKYDICVLIKLNPHSIFTKYCMCCVSCPSLVQILSVKRTGRKYRDKILSIHVHAVNKAHF